MKVPLMQHRAVHRWQGMDIGGTAGRKLDSDE